MKAHRGTVSRGHKKRERTRAQLIEAGVSVLAQKGEALTVSDVVEAARVSSGTFYNYFTDRRDLLGALAEHTLTTLAPTSRSDTRDPAENIASITAAILSRAESDPTWARAVLRLTDSKKSFPRAMAQFMHEELSSGRDTGRFQFGPDEVTLDLLVGFLMASIRRITGGKTPAEYPTRVVDRALRALGVPADEAKKLATEAFERAR